jgi:hypothetical protein
MAEVGHSSPTMTLSLYAQVVTVEEDFGALLEARSRRTGHSFSPLKTDDRLARESSG